MSSLYANSPFLPLTLPQPPPPQAITDSFNSNASRLHVHFTNSEVYIAVAIYAIGGMTGALSAGIIADHIGRYTTIIACIFHFHISSTYTLVISLLKPCKVTVYIYLFSFECCFYNMILFFFQKVHNVAK